MPPFRESVALLGSMPFRILPAMSVPSFSTVSALVPPADERERTLVPRSQVDPAPVTVTVPEPVLPLPISLAPLVTLPPSTMVSVPMPLAPTVRLAVPRFQVDPAPVTVTSPVAPE